MARPIKAGVDYFPHDTDASSRKTIFTLESMFGNDGYAFWFKLLETLGTQEGLFFDCNKVPDWLFLIAKMRVNSDTATEILNTLAKIEAIDPELWDKKIIWIQNFTDRLNDVYKKRSTDIPQKPDFRSENNSFRTENPSSNDINGTIIPQSKGKKTKAKERITNSPSFPQGGAGASDSNIQEKRFDEFWAIYPKKTGKQAAFKSWQRVKPTAEFHSRIIAAVTAATKTEQWQRENGRYIPNPTTWLNQGRWDDEIAETITDAQQSSNYKQDYKMEAGQIRKAGSAAPGFKLAGEPDDEYEQVRPVLSGFHMAE